MLVLFEHDVCRQCQDGDNGQELELDLPPSQQIEMSDVSSFKAFAAVRGEIVRIRDMGSVWHLPANVAPATNRT